MLLLPHASSISSSPPPLVRMILLLPSNMTPPLCHHGLTSHLSSSLMRAPPSTLPKRYWPLLLQPPPPSPMASLASSVSLNRLGCLPVSLPFYYKRCVLLDPSILLFPPPPCARYSLVQPLLLSTSLPSTGACTPHPPLLPPTDTPRTPPTSHLPSPPLSESSPSTSPLPTPTYDKHFTVATAHSFLPPPPPFPPIHFPLSPPFSCRHGAHLVRTSLRKHSGASPSTASLALTSTLGDARAPY